MRDSDSRRTGRSRGADWTLRARDRLQVVDSARRENVLEHGRGDVRILLDEASVVARELHDGLAQSLFALVTTAKHLRRRLDSDPACREVERILELARAATRDLRVAFAALESADCIAGRGLAAALADLREQTQEVVVDVAVDEELAEAEDLPAELLYRACREGLRNVVRHARARRCVIRCIVAGAAAVATVKDDGGGLASKESPDAFGIRFLREALERAGGSLELRTAGEGTVLRAVVPRAS